MKKKSQEGIAKSSGKASMADRELMLRQVFGFQTGKILGKNGWL